jgi:hypothetical protein
MNVAWETGRGALVTLVLYVAALFLAMMEVEVEGPEGWATGMDYTWKDTSSSHGICGDGLPTTGYHITNNLVVYSLLVAGFTSAAITFSFAEELLPSRFILLLACHIHYFFMEDDAWFALNPYTNTQFHAYVDHLVDTQVRVCRYGLSNVLSVGLILLSFLLSNGLRWVVALDALAYSVGFVVTGLLSLLTTRWFVRDGYIFIRCAIARGVGWDADALEGAECNDVNAGNLVTLIIFGLCIVVIFAIVAFVNVRAYQKKHPNNANYLRPQ